MSEKLGQYIVIEGTDGAGTTTQKDLLQKTLIENNENVIGLAEPGGTLIGDELRLIVKNGSLPRSPETNLDIFTICRRELVRQVIEPALEEGTHVISDRNWFSTIAYQGFGEGLSIEDITNRMKLALGKLFLPNFAVIIDVPVEVSEVRIGHRGTDANDNFEKKGRDFFEKVREGYLWIAKEYDLSIIDGTQSIKEVQSSIEDLLPKTLLS